MNPSSRAYGIPQCLPLRTRILTRRGWINHDEVRPGDETIGYNPDSGRSEWTVITHVHRYADAPLVRLRNKTWQVTCTPNHRWMSSRLHQVDGRRQVNGVRSGRSTSFRRDEFVTTDKITPFDSLRLAAPADLDNGPAISDGEAELLGWVMGDGSVASYSSRRDGATVLGKRVLRVAQEHPGASNRAIARIVGCTHQTVGAYLRANDITGRGAHARTGTGSMTRIGLYQAKPEGVAAVDELLAREHLQFSRHVYAPKGIARLPRVTWMLHASYSAELIKRSGYDHQNPVPFVLSLSPSQRDAFLRGVFGAEGSQGKPVTTFGRGPYPAQRLYSQADGAQQDVIVLALYLSGHRPAIHNWSAASRARFQCSPGANIAEAKPRIGGGAVKREDAGHAPVWCPTTELGTWTARQDRQVFLTGNSQYSDPAGAAGNQRAFRWHDTRPAPGCHPG